MFFSGAENEPRDIHPNQGLPLYGKDANKKLQHADNFFYVLVSRDDAMSF